MNDNQEDRRKGDGWKFNVMIKIHPTAWLLRPLWGRIQAGLVFRWLFFGFLIGKFDTQPIIKE